MRYLLAIAVLLAGGGYPSSLHAQHRGGSHSFASARGGFGFRAFRAAPGSAREIRLKPAPGLLGNRPGSPVRTRHHYQLDAGYWPGTPCLTNPGYAGSYFCRQYLPHSRYSYVPFYGFPLWYGLNSYPSEEEATSPAPAPAPAENADLAGEVEHLAEEVELLREEPSAPAASAPAAAAPAPEEKPVPAVLVFRDGHKGEAENYAVLGQTLYVFEGERTRKIPLAQLDLAATQKVNEEQGVEFVPTPTP